MDARLVNLLITNDPPSEDAMREVNRLMAAPLQELNQADSKIADLKAQLASLEGEREKIQSSLQGYRTIMFPIRRLPNDILDEIFYHCLPSHRNPILNVADAPMLLTRVSSRWRSVAFSSPRLWARLYISFCDDDRGSFPPYIANGLPDMDRHEERLRKARQVLNQRVEVIHDWLARSGSCPLSVSLTYSSSLYDAREEREEIYPPDDATTKLFETILSHSHHLRSLELMMPMEIYRQLDSMVSLHSLSILTDLKTNFYHQVPLPEQAEKHEAVKLFEAPLLQRLSLDGYPASRLWALDTFPFADEGKHLTYFSSHVLFSPSEGFHLLKQCDNLVHCRLHIVPFLDGNAMAIQGIAFLPKLRSLALIDDNSSVDRANQFYTSIDAPHLLWIDYAIQSYGPDLNGTTPQDRLPILHLLKRSMELRKLTLDPHSLTCEELREVLQTVSPTVTHLVIGQESVRRSPKLNRPYGSLGSVSLDLGILAIDKNSNPNSEDLLPKLKIFELCTSSISDETLLHIIISRMEAASRDRCAVLRHVHVIASRPQKLDIEKEVELYREHNMGGAGCHIDDIKLDLEYDAEAELMADPLSSSFGLQNDRLWPHPDLDEPVRDY